MNTLRRVVASLLILALVVGAIFILRDCFTEDTLRTISVSYDVGSLSTVSGTYVEDSDNAIYTKDMFECKGLRVTPNFDGDITYKVFFYDQDRIFLSCTESLDRVYDDVPIIACYARVEITPNSDDSISWFEKFSYSTKVKIEVATVQKGIGDNVLEFSYDNYSSLQWTSDDVDLSDYEYLILRVNYNADIAFRVKDSAGSLIYDANISFSFTGGLNVTIITQAENFPAYTRYEQGLKDYFVWRITDDMANAFVIATNLTSAVSLYLI